MAQTQAPLQQICVLTRNTILRRQCTRWHTNSRSTAECLQLCNRKFVTRRRVYSASLTPHVVHVVSARSLKKMPRVDAPTIVACMQQAITRPTAVKQKPCEPMRVVRAAAIPCNTVTRWAARAVERPACRCSAPVDLLPKPCDCLFVHAGNLRVGLRPGRVVASQGAFGGA